MIAPGTIQPGGRRDRITRDLLSIARRLPEAERQNLLRFAEFLLQRVTEAPSAAPVIPEPEPIPRPAQESVIKAMRRLSRTYPMLDRGPLLNETSTLMAQHVMQGRPAVEVIDELENIFRRQYEQLRAPP